MIKMPFYELEVNYLEYPSLVKLVNKYEGISIRAYYKTRERTFLTIQRNKETSDDMFMEFLSMIRIVYIRAVANIVDLWNVRSAITK